MPRIALAYHYQTRGRHDRARALVTEILRVSPAYTAKTAASRYLNQAGVADSAADAEIAETLRQAGLP